MVYPALLPLMRTPRLPVVDCTDAPADSNGPIRFAKRRNLVSVHVPSHFKRSLPVQCHYLTPAASQPGYHTDQELLAMLHLLMYLGC